MNIVETKDVRRIGVVESIHFESLIDLIDTSENSVSIHDNRWAYRKHISMTDLSGKDPRWFGKGNNNYKDVMDKALSGDPAMLENLNDKISLFKKGEMENKFESRSVKKAKRKKVRAEFGEEIDIHKVYQGQLDKAWSSHKRIEIDVEHHLVTLFVDVGGLRNEKVSDSLWRAAVAVKVADDLIKAGKSVQVVIGSSCTNLHSEAEVVMTSIVVKKYNEPLSMERLAAMSHLGFHRTFNFGARAFSTGSISRTMGYSSDHCETIPPIQMYEDVESGSVKYIYIPRCLSLYDANMAIDNIYKGF